MLKSTMRLMAPWVKHDLPTTLGIFGNGLLHNICGKHYV